MRAQAQVADVVSQLVSAENYLAALVKQKGIARGYLKAVDDESIFFAPGPVKAKDHFRALKDEGALTWEPVIARVAKSGDWGYTSGPFTYISADSSATVYGDYISIWKRNPRGVWRLAARMSTEHPKPAKASQALRFENPKNTIFLHQKSQNRLQQREDIVLSSDQLLASVEKADVQIALKEFLADDSRLLFPGAVPLTGKKAIADFVKKQNFRLQSAPVAADRSYSGELAYTHGETAVIRNGKTEKHYYLRVWEVQPGYNWNILLQGYKNANTGF
jgi:ketosteroid isomerase-like protein